MKRIVLILLVLFSAGALDAQDSSGNEADTLKPWKTTGQIGLSFAQVGLTNWAAGGENSLSANAAFRLTSIYTQNKTSWENYVLLGYGLVKQGDRDFQKNDDKIEFISKYGYKAGKSWYYSGLLNFRTQFAEGYKTVEDSVKFSDFFAPAYLTASLGMDFKPNENFGLLISPLTGKWTIVTDEYLSGLGTYGLEPGEKVRSEVGGFIKLIYKQKDLIKNVNVATTVDLFTNYLENPEKIDVNWELFVDMKVTNLLTVSLNTLLIYDYDIKFTEIENGNPVEKAKVQFKEVFGVGLSYSF